MADPRPLQGSRASQLWEGYMAVQYRQHSRFLLPSSVYYYQRVPSWCRFSCCHAGAPQVPGKRQNRSQQLCRGTCSCPSMRLALSCALNFRRFHSSLLSSSSPGLWSTKWVLEVIRCYLSTIMSISFMSSFTAHIGKATGLFGRFPFQEVSAAFFCLT